jgi:hypothetical protein
MLIDMVVLAALSWLVAKALNMVFFKTSPASTVVAWTLTIGYFLLSVVIASVIKTMRHSALNESLGLSPSYQNPMDMATAFLMAYVFYLVLNTVARSRPSKPVTASKGINPPTAVYATPPLTLSSGLALPAAQTPAPTRLPPNEMPKMEDIEDRIYAQVGEELESGNTDKGIWTKAFAQAGGDDKNTRLLYIQLRVAKLLALEEEKEKIRYAEMQAAAAERARIEKMSLKQKISAGAIGREEAMDKVGKGLAQEFLLAVRNGPPAKAERMVEEHPLLLAVRNSQGETCLHIATREKWMGLIPFLVERGACINSRDNEGNTPGSIAHAMGSPAMNAVFSEIERGAAGRMG